MKVEAYKTWRYDWSRRTDQNLYAEVFELLATELEITPSGSGGRTSLNFDVRPTGREFLVRESISITMLAMQSDRDTQRYVLERLTRLAAQALIKVALTKALPELFSGLGETFADFQTDSDEVEEVQMLAPIDVVKLEKMLTIGDPDQCDKTLEACKDKFHNEKRFGGFLIPGSLPPRTSPCVHKLGDIACGYDPEKHDRNDFVIDGAVGFDGPPFIVDGTKSLCDPPNECEHCYDTGYWRGLGAPCPSGCPPRT